MDSLSVSLSTVLKIECGAISIVIASFGMCFKLLSIRTGPMKLFRKYLGEQYSAVFVAQFSSGIDEDIHFDDLFCGVGMSC